MAPVDLNAIMALKKAAIKRCEERILEAASRPEHEHKRIEEIPECYGVTQVLKKRHGL
jgi:hypothetical protein